MCLFPPQPAFRIFVQLLSIGCVLFLCFIPNANPRLIPNVFRCFVRKPIGMALAHCRQGAVEDVLGVATIGLCRLVT